MPQQIPYTQALRFAEHCLVADEFLQEYGSALLWQNCMIDTGELMAFVDRVIGQ